MKRKQSKIFNSKNMPYMILFLLLGTVMGTTVTSEYIMLYDNVWVLRIDGTVVLNNSDNNVNIGENESTDYKLKVNGTTHLNGTVNVSGDIIPFSSNVYNLGGPGLCWNNLFINNITSCNDVLNITSNTNIKENLTVTNNISCGNLTVTNNINLNNLSLENISVNNITEFTTGYGIHLINDTYVSTDLDVGDRLDVGGDVVVVDDIWCDVAYTRMVGINSSVYHRGDPDTFMYYNDNEVYFTVEGNKTLQITSYLVEIWRNLTVHGNITADENITAKYFIGNGSGLWGINVSNITGNITFENISANNFTQYNDYGIHFLHNVNITENLTTLETIIGQKFMSLHANNTHGIDSVAFNFNTSAYGNYATAIGYSSNASGLYSFAGNRESIASGVGSFAFGRRAYATSANCIAMSYGAQATAGNAMALGDRAEAHGLNSLALGIYYPIVWGEYSIVSGKYINLTANNSQLYGTGVGWSNRLRNPIDYSWAVGINSTKPTLFLDDAHGVGNLSNFGIGTSNPHCRLTVNGSTCISGNLTVNGTSFLGNITINASSASIENISFNNASQYNNYGIHFLDNITLHDKLFFDGLILIGNSSTTGVGPSSIVIGHNASGDSTQQTVLGDFAEARCTASTAIGYLAFVSATQGVAIGPGTNAADEGTAIGNAAGSTGIESTSVGSQSTADGNAAVAVGKAAGANFDESISLGYSPSAGAKYSIAIGSGGIGHGTSTDAEYSIAMGYDARAHGLNSIALGLDAIAWADNSMAIGPFNETTEYTIGTNWSFSTSADIYVGGNITVNGTSFLGNVTINASDISTENLSVNNISQYNNYGINFLHNVTLVGNRTIKATETLTLGEDGLITIGSNIERDMYPLFDLKVNLGNSTHRFNDFFMGGNLNGNDSDAYFKNLTVGDNIYSENISCNNFSKYNDYGIHFLDDVNILGSLNVTNNITGNFFYAEARYHYRLGMALNFVQNVYYNITFNSSDNINGFTWDGDSNLTCNKAGLYSINFQSSGDGVNNHQYYLSVGINHVYQEELESPKKLNSGGDILTMSGTGFIRLAENDVVSLMMVDVTGNGAGTYYGSNLNLVRIGD